MTEPRRRRANGEESRRKIIEAATEIAAERGYEGTSISLVRERSGLPSSSIYWHFADKDELIAAVIEHSFEQWRTLMSVPSSERAGGLGDAITSSMRRTGRALVEAPDFLRLGLMLALERRPEEPSARARFLDVRRASRADSEAFYRRLLGDGATEHDVTIMARMTMAAADGMFVAKEIDDDQFDVDEAFELIGAALTAVAEQLRARRSVS